MIAVECSRCREELTEPGGLAFSPATDEYAWAVEKLHLCVECWRDFYDWIDTSAGTPPPREETTR